MDSVRFVSRWGAISRGEREWRVEEDALVTRGASGRERRYPWKDIVSVRLLHDPTRHKPWRYVFELQPKDRRKIEIDNGHFLRRDAYEDRSAAFTPFVRESLARLAVANPKARALIGETPKRYFFLLLTALVLLGGLAYVLVAVPTPLDQAPFANLVKLGLILLMLPVFWGWVLRAMPRGVPLDAIPDRALPPTSDPS